MDNSVLTERQSLAVSMILKLPSSLSLLGSLAIVYANISDRKKRLGGSTYHRIMFGMSCVDIIQSSALFFSTLAFPAEAPNSTGNFGTVETCEAQGFLIQLGLAMPLYSVILTIYYLLVVRYGYTETDVSQSIEPMMHTFCLVLPFIGAVYSLKTDNFNPMLAVCHIAAYPAGCDVDDDVECTRGQNAKYVALVTGAGWILAAITIVPFNMMLLYCTVRQQEARSHSNVIVRTRSGNSSDFDLNAETPTRHSHQENAVAYYSTGSKRLRSVLHQSLKYVGGFFLVFMWVPVYRIAGVRLEKSQLFPILIFNSFFYPLQGFFNFLIYIEPRVAVVRKRKPEWSYLKAMAFAAVKPKTVESQLPTTRRTRIRTSGINSSFRSLNLATESSGLSQRPNIHSSSRSNRRGSRNGDLSDDDGLSNGVNYTDGSVRTLFCRVGAYAARNDTDGEAKEPEFVMAESDTEPDRDLGPVSSRDKSTHSLNSNAGSRDNNNNQEEGKTPGPYIPDEYNNDLEVIMLTEDINLCTGPEEEILFFPDSGNSSESTSIRSLPTIGGDSTDNDGFPWNGDGQTKDENGEGPQEVSEV